MLQPTAKAERITPVDILRGFALLGVLAVNMLDFSSPVFMPEYHAPNYGVLDELAEAAIFFFATSKFYLLFSFLFGLGFAIQMRRTTQTERAFVPFYLRRLGILFIFGVLHGLLLWHGDILSTYALAGVALLTLRNVRTSRLLLLAGVFMVISLLIFGASEEFSEWQGEAMTADRLTDIIKTSTYWEMVEFRVDSLDQVALMIAQVPSVFAMFLIGLVIGRGGYVERLSEYMPLMRRAGWIGLAIGLPGNAVFVWGLAESDMLLAAVGMTIGAPALSIFYVSLIARYAHRLKFLAPVGQMALTNYLSQTVICTTLFYGYGFGLYNEINPFPRLLLIFGIYGAQIVVSHLWLRRFRFGPMEWLWRSLTYGKAQPMVRTAIIEGQVSQS